MGSSVNKAIIVGNLGGDPIRKHGSNGKDFFTFSVATSEHWTDRGTGEKRERTDWHSVVVFNERLNNFCENFLRKGTKVYIEGKLRTRSWENQQGEKQYKTEIIIDEFKGEIVLTGSRNPIGQNGDYDDHEEGGRNYQPQPARQPEARPSGQSDFGSFGDGTRDGRGAGSFSGGRRPNGNGHSWDIPDGDLDDEIPF